MISEDGLGQPAVGGGTLSAAALAGIPGLVVHRKVLTLFVDEGEFVGCWR
jgi:hypothetical protein